MKHSAGEYVREQAHSNGVELFWLCPKEGFMAPTTRSASSYLQRYVNEFDGRHNQRSVDTADKMRIIAEGFTGKLLSYKGLAA